MNVTKREADEAWARMAAEDRAVSYLVDNNRFSPPVSIAIATRVEFLLAVAWEDEQEEMRARRDRRIVIEIRPGEMQAIRRAFAATPPGMSDAAAERHVVDIITKFPPDRAWFIAHKVRDAVVRLARRPYFGSGTSDHSGEHAAGVT